MFLWNARSATITCLLLICTTSMRSLAQIDSPQPIPIWPAAAPGEKGDIGPEHDTTKPDPKAAPDKYITRLGQALIDREESIPEHQRRQLHQAPPPHAVGMRAVGRPERVAHLRLVHHAM